MKVPRTKMFGWYDPGALLRTAVDVGFSTIFGRHSDVRVLEAITPVEPGQAASFFDYTKQYKNSPQGEPIPIDQPREDIWIDYVADVGDGWNSTYAVAYYISRDLQLSKQIKDAKTYETKRGTVLVMGGDQVYPVASREAYATRLGEPYKAALEYTTSPSPHLFAVPGNHDWYDSLSSFLRLFCQQRWFAGWKTRQNRSYFALKLPRNWWLLGTDVQLASDIDDGQVTFFKAIAEKMKRGDRIIVCNAEPHWIYAHIYGKDDSNYTDNNLAFLENKIFCNQTISVFLAGDLHHYRRHAADDGTQKITAGGGGAFLHPTHGPEVETITESSNPKGGPPRDFNCKEAFPDLEESARICWRNWLFLFLNPKFGVLTATLYTFTAWAVWAPLAGYEGKDWLAAVRQAILSAMTNQTGALWIVTLLLAVIFFTDTHSRIYRGVGGLLHGLTHLAVIFFVGWGIDRYLGISALSQHVPPLPQTIPKLSLAALMMFTAGWIIGSEIFGIYLWVSLNVFRRHQNEAFSSLHIPDFKNFLRLHINSDGTLTIYPIGIRTVPRKWREVKTAEYSAKFEPNDQNATQPTLIEEPISIH